MKPKSFMNYQKMQNNPCMKVQNIQGCLFWWNCHNKCLCGMSDKSMTMILELLKDVFEHAKLTSSFYEAKKMITKLGLIYKMIIMCPNDCMLFWGSKDDEERETCKVCQTSKWKSMVKVGVVSLITIVWRKCSQNFFIIFHWNPDYKDCFYLQRQLRIWDGLLWIVIMIEWWGILEILKLQNSLTQHTLGLLMIHDMFLFHTTVLHGCAWNKHLLLFW